LERILLCALFLAAPASASVEPTLAAIVDRSLEAYGGRQALARAAALRQRGRVTSAMRGGRAGALTRLFERPGRLRVEVAFPGEEPEIRVLDGARGWRQGSQVEGPPYSAMVLQAARLDLPLLLAERRAQLLDGGMVTRDGKQLRAVTVPLGPGLWVSAEIDPATGRILRSTGTLEGGPSGRIEFATSYGDFRKVGKVLIPFREGNFAMGGMTGETVLEKVELLRALPVETFRP
jgi:hypothetical protein